MSRYEDKWLDICTLLMELQSNGKVLVIPAKHSGKTRQLSFQLNGAFSETSSALIVEILRLADWFEFSVNSDKVLATVFVDLSATS